MADLKTLAVSRSALLKFDPRAIKTKPGLNGRDLETPENVEHIEWLAKSMIENGWIDSHPLEVFSEGDDVFVSDGHCRLAAALLAIARGCDIKTVTAVPERRGTNEFERILNQNLANSGKRLTPLEEGHNIKRAINLGATIKQVAEMLGKSETYVAQALDFQAAPVEVHAMVRAGEVSATLAAKVIRQRGNAGVAAIRNAVDAAKASGKGRATEKHIEAAGEAAYNERRDPVDAMKIVDKGADVFAVTIGRTDYVMSGMSWVRLAYRILDEVRPRLAPDPNGGAFMVKTPRLPDGVTYEDHHTGEIVHVPVETPEHPQMVVYRDHHTGEVVTVQGEDPQHPPGEGWVNIREGIAAAVAKDRWPAE